MDSSLAARDLYLFVLRQCEETLTRMFYAVDAHQWDMLNDRVFADEVTTDYSEMFGWPPQTRKAAEQAQNWKDTMSKAEKTQHVITGFLPLDLSWPLTESELQSRTQVTFHANVLAYLRRRTDDGTVLETQNGGRGEFILEKKKVNTSSGKDIQWRVRSYKAFGAFDKGGQEFWHLS